MASNAANGAPKTSIQKDWILNLNLMCIVLLTPRVQRR